MQRAHITRVMHRYLDDLGFIEIETPILAKSTPEGARDYLVPSRVHPGEFYALPQSPQQFKQLLMIAGFEKYYQVARCFRDEDLRADRQLDFTQLDIETSFMSELEIQTMMEGLLQKVMKEVKGIDIETPFLRLTFEEAMNRYGSDKPDNRFGMELIDVNEVFKDSSFKVFKECLENKGSIKAIVVPDKADMTRKEIDKITEYTKKNGAKGLVTLKYIDNELSGPIVKFLTEEEINNIVNTLKLNNNDLVCIVSDEWEKCCNALGALRLHMGKMLGLCKTNEFSFLWVVDFPLLEYSEEDGRYYAKHHPFTRPKPEDVALLDTDPSKVKACAYDVVLNGYELGGDPLEFMIQKCRKKCLKY